ncbi:hypothetical protein AX15_001859 [Amanita polypyramis BW_CC]|nr:hypothetical protein AX15_001859 [Amanita polypyramis BW_CC]
MRIATGYIPHALYAIAVTSISIHLVNKRRTFSDEKANVNARISILESIAEQLQSNKSIPNAELERLKRLARAPVKENLTTGAEHISWKEVVFGREQQASDELNHWEKKDLEKGSAASRLVLKDLSYAPF